jgi:hypothetical protein
VITLAVITGIPASEWAKEGLRGVATAFEVWEEIHRPDQTRDGTSTSDGRQYSG